MYGQYTLRIKSPLNPSFYPVRNVKSKPHETRRFLRKLSRIHIGAFVLFGLIDSTGAALSYTRHDSIDCLVNLPFSTKKIPILRNIKKKKNAARLQMAASNTSHWSRCQVVLNKRLFSEIVLLIKFFLSHNWSCWILSQFEFLKFVKLWVEFGPNSSFWVLLEFFSS